MASTNPYNIEIQQRATFTLQVTYADPNGVPIDLDGSTIRMDVRAKPDSTSTLFSLSSPSNGIVITDAPNGVFTITITDEQTSAPSAPIDGVYDVVVEDSAGAKSRILEGRALFTVGVTQ